MARVSSFLLAVSFVLMLSVIPIPAAPPPLHRQPTSPTLSSTPLATSAVNDVPVSSFPGTVIGEGYIQPGQSQGSVMYVNNCSYTVPTTCDAIIKTAGGGLIDFRYSNNQNLNGLGAGDSVIVYIFIPNGTASVERTYYNPTRS